MQPCPINRWCRRTLISPSPYKDPEGHKAAQKLNTLERDAGGIYALALTYRLFGDEKYAQNAVRLIDAWEGVGSFQSGGPTPANEFYPRIIVAADLLKHSPSFSPTEQEAFRAYLRKKILPLSMMKRNNNLGDFGVLLVLTGGAYLDDAQLFRSGIERWKSLVNSQVAPDGSLPEEVTREKGRMGFWYMNFCLFAKACGAEVARVNGIDLYDYVGPQGASLEKAYRKSIPWLKDPASFPWWQGDLKQLTGINHVPHLELLVMRWPDADAEAVLLKNRPVHTNFGFPYLTLTHGDLLNDKVENRGTRRD